MNTSLQKNAGEIYTETLTFVERRHEYDQVSTYIFKPSRPVRFIAGQYAHIRLLSLPEGTKRVHELSLASSPQDSDIWIGVDSRSGSAYQQALLALSPGDTIELFKIKGHMTWPAPTTDVVMIAAGVGITPFRSMLLDAKERNLPLTTTLVQVARETFLYADELNPLVDAHMRINRAMLSDTLTRVAHEHPSAHYYIAGSPGFVQTVVATLTEQGIASIESDEFKGLLTE